MKESAFSLFIFTSSKAEVMPLGESNQEMLVDLKCIKINLNWRECAPNFGIRHVACGMCFNGCLEGPIQGRWASSPVRGTGSLRCPFSEAHPGQPSLILTDVGGHENLPKLCLVPGKMLRADVFIVIASPPLCFLAGSSLSKPWRAEASSQGEPGSPLYPDSRSFLEVSQVSNEGLF